MNKLILLLISALLFSCTKTRGVTAESDKIEISNSTLDIENKTNKLERLKAWIDSTNILALPFKANFDTTTETKFRVKFWDTDSIFIEDFKRSGGDVYIMGLLSDTTDFYGFIFISVAAFHNPGLVTFNKSGNKVDLQLLTRENCVIYAGDVLLCKEYTEISKDWSLNYFYKSIVVTEFIESQLDTTCARQDRQGYVSKTGVIKLGELMDLDCSMH